MSNTLQSVVNFQDLTPDFEFPIGTRALLTNLDFDRQGGVVTLDIALSAMHCHWEIAQRVTDSQLDIVIPDSLAVGSAMLHVSTYDPGVDRVHVGHMLVNERKRTIGRGSKLPLSGVSELIVNSVAYVTRQRSKNQLGGLYEGEILVPENLDSIARVTYM